MLEKSPEAYKTISEAAEELGVEQHVLRFWETKFTQIKPLKRRGGRRYYRPEDMEVLHRIRHLLYKQGFTIKGAKKAMSVREPAAETAAAIAETQEAVPVKPAAKAPGKKAQPASLDQLDLLAPPPAAVAPAAPAGISATQRKMLEGITASLKAARKDLQSVA